MPLGLMFIFASFFALSILLGRGIKAFVKGGIGVKIAILFLASQYIIPLYIIIFEPNVFVKLFAIFAFIILMIFSIIGLIIHKGNSGNSHE